MWDAVSSHQARSGSAHSHSLCVSAVWLPHGITLLWALASPSFDAVLVADCSWASCAFGMAALSSAAEAGEIHSCCVSLCSATGSEGAGAIPSVLEGSSGFTLILQVMEKG